MSVRRDLRRLEDRGLIKRTHGGATSVGPGPQPPAPQSHGVLQARSALVDRADVLIVTPIKTDALELLVRRCQRAGTPVIAESLSYPGATTCVSIDDFGASVALGRWTGNELVRKSRLGDLTVLDVTCGNLSNTTARSQGFAEGLRDTLGKRHTVIRVDGQGLRRPASQMVAEALLVNPAINVIFGINDHSMLGALDAWRAAGRADDDLFLVSLGLEGQRSRELLRRGGPYKAAVAMFPEIAGRLCIEAAVCAFHHSPLPERVTTPHALLTPETLEDYYTCDEASGQWGLKTTAYRQLLALGTRALPVEACRDGRRPARIGWVQVLSSHAWYQNIRQALHERCRELGIRLESIDASHDLEAEIEYFHRNIGRTAAQFIEEGDTLILDTGAATTHLATHLHGRQNLTVITNSLDVASQLGDEPGLRVMVSGGQLRSASHGLVGKAAEAALRGLRASKAFLTCAGLSLNFGLSTHSASEAGVKRAMLEAAREVFLLADHTAIGHEALIQIVPFGHVHHLVTDAGLSAHDRVALSQRGLDVIVAEDPVEKDNG